MKYKLLATCVAAAVLVGCGEDSNDSSTIQAYDGAIQGIEGNYSCTDDSGAIVTGDIPKTGADGYASINNNIVRFSPENCTFTFIKTAGAVDVSNGKDMSDLSLSIPKGLAKAGSAPKATPFTTLVAKALGGAEYTDAAATTVLTDLGFGDFLNNGLATPSELMTDLESVIDKLKTSSPENYSKLVATTHILSDVLVKSETLTLSVKQIATASQNIVTKTIKKHANYPTSSTGGVIVINIKEDSNYDDLSSVASKVLNDSEIASLPEPKEQESKPVTGGDNTNTGGTGGTGGTGTGSDSDGGNGN